MRHNAGLCRKRLTLKHLILTNHFIMRRTFTFLVSLVAMLLTSTCAWAGDNDLLWDYTETAPTEKPDNGLYYAANVNDGAGTKNGLKGIKLNSSGYCYFAKAAVEGTLKLTIGPRDGSKEFNVSVYACTITDGTATKGNLIADTETVTEANTVSVDIPADVTGIYIERKAPVEGVLTKIVFTEKVARSFKDFEMKLGNLSAEYDTSTLPEGVTFSGTYNSDQHGYRNATVTVPVDGTVKFTIGDCKYGNKAITVTNETGGIVTTLSYAANGCYADTDKDRGNVFTYLYVGDAATLTFGPVQYLNYFKAEATEVKAAVITFKDQNGTTIGTKDCYEGDAIGEIPADLKDKLTIPEGSAFRGWVYSTQVKALPTDVVNGNTTISALVTPVESVSIGSIQTYDLTKKNFYPEDHETVSIENASYYNDHGWLINNGGIVSVDVAGKAQVVLTECQYGNGTTITVTDAAGNTVATDVAAKVEKDGSTVAVNYNGEATTLHLTFATAAYLHKVTVYNVQDFLEKDEATGYYIVPAGDAAAMVLAINEANSTAGTKIFLPAGVYDLGEATCTTLSGTNTSIIGEGTDKTIIRNCPPISEEGLGKADLLLNTGTGLYLQDLTLKNDLDYYAAGSAGRAAALHDKGTQTILKNVNLRSYQDTYYSNKKGGYYYFENDTLQGTVDYLCGDGRVYYNKCTLYNAKRTSGDTMTANSELYVFNNCDVLCEDDNTPYNFGRAWSDDNDGKGPFCVFLNTTLKDNGAKLIADRWNTSGINCDYGIAGEYNTMNAAGENITPAENKLTFKKNSTLLNTILTADALTTYSIENTLGDWAATAQSDAKQVTEMPESGIFLVDGKVTNVKPTTGKARVANNRGGFGPEIDVESSAISAVTASAEAAIAPVYNIAGQRINSAAKGIYIQSGHKFVK